MRNRSKSSIINKITILSITIFVSIIISFSFSERRKIKKSRELDRFVKLYKFIPFNIPRDGDGVGTIIAFKKRAEVVIAAPNECLKLDQLTIDTLKGNLPNFEYSLSKKNDLEFNTGKIFGENIKLISAYKDKRVDSVKVNFEDVFEIRTSRISVKKHIPNIDSLCIKETVKKKNYLIERVLGVGSISISFYNKSGTEIELDVSLMDEIKLGDNFKEEFQGKSSLVFNEPRLIGYRIWDVDMELGFAEKAFSLDTIPLIDVLNLKLE